MAQPSSSVCPPRTLWPHRSPPQTLFISAESLFSPSTSAGITEADNIFSGRPSLSARTRRHAAALSAAFEPHERRKNRKQNSNGDRELAEGVGRRSGGEKEGGGGGRNASTVCGGGGRSGAGRAHVMRDWRHARLESYWHRPSRILGGVCTK